MSGYPERELKIKYPTIWREVTVDEGVLCLLEVDGITGLEKALFSLLFTLSSFPSLRIMHSSNKGKNNCDQAKHEYI